MARIRLLALVLTLGSALGLGPPCADAAVNRAVGGIGGTNNGTLQGGDGTGQALVILNVVDLALEKQARDPAGGVLPPGSPVTAGSEVWFVLYVDNPTQAPADSLQIIDALDESAFAYIPGTLAVTMIPAGSSDVAMWNAPWSPLTDAPGAPDDVGSVVDSRGPPGPDHVAIGAAPGQVNRVAAIPPQTRLAVRFRVRVNP